MKITKISVLLGLIFSLLIIGCKKEVPAPDGNYYNTNSLKAAPDDMRLLYAIPITDDWGNIIKWIYLGCAWPAHNCLPTVEIDGGNSSNSMSDPTRIAYDDFISKFNNGIVSEFFTTGDYLTLFPELINMPDVVEGLSNSEILLYHKVGDDDGFDYYVGLSAGIEYLSDWAGDEKCVFVIDYQ